MPQMGYIASLRIRCVKQEDPGDVVPKRSRPQSGPAYLRT